MSYQKIHMVGIGGVGMSALAQMLAHEGVMVTGSDRSESPVTGLLEQKGIHVQISQAAENMPEDTEAVVYSDAVMSDNPERAEAARRGIPQFSYFQMLGKVSVGDAAKSPTGEKRTIAVAGTHGKTTTTGMLTKILIDGGANPTAIIGSIVRDFGSNFVAGGSELFVVEADEFRAHLLELSPEVLVITNLEWDHTDFYPTLEALQATFRKAIARVPSHGAIVTDVSNPNIAPLLVGVEAKVVDYKQEGAFELLLPGTFNQNNARAAAAAARFVAPNISEEVIKNALATFHGTWRRFELKGKTARGALVYDDYAHHPTAIKETLKALRAKTKGKVFVAFHPHLYSRTRDLFNDFVRAFTDADEVLIAPIYAAREVDDGTVSSVSLAEAIAKNGVHARAALFNEIERILKTEPGSTDVVMTMGAGDIYKIADRIAA